MDQQRVIQISKYLARHLRHRPERIGIQPDAAGWVDVSELLAACARDGFAIRRAELDLVVAANDKKRYAFDGTRLRVRASQGHSIPVDLDLPTATPPPTLFHGTSEASLPAIMREGLRPMNRHDVHLSADEETARRVGARRRTPVVLIVDAAAMVRAGHAFRVSANGVWLVSAVPPDYLAQPGSGVR